MNTRYSRGFTLWELLVTVLVIGIVLGFGVPNLLEFRRNNTMASTANDLISALMAARGEAVKRRVFVTLCASPDPLATPPVCSPTGAGTTGGYIVWVDENGDFLPNGAPDLSDATDGNALVDAGETTVLIRREAGFDITAFAAGTGGTPSGYVSFGPNGWRRNAPGAGADSADIVLYCDPRGNVPAAGSLSAARAVRVDPTGRGSVVSEVTDITVATAPFGLSCP